MVTIKSNTVWNWYESVSCYLLKIDLGKWKSNII